MNDIEKGKVVRIPFRTRTAYNISKTGNTATISELEILPANLGARVVAMAACFEYYRIVKLRVKQFPSCNAPVHYDSNILNVTLGVIGLVHANAFEPSDATRTGTPTGLEGLMNAPAADMSNARGVVKYSVPRSTLLSQPLKWWNTTSTGSPTETLVQGLMWAYSYNEEDNSQATSPALNILISGEIEFKGMILPTLSFSSQLAEKRIVASQSDKESIISLREDYQQVLRPPEKDAPRLVINSQSRH